MPAALTTQQKSKFLQRLKTSHGNVSKAANGIKISRAGVYVVKAKDADFSSAWDDILASVYDEMEHELYRRAVVGWVDKDGIKRKSDRLLEFALKGNRAEKFRERFDVNQNVTGTLDLNIQATINQIYADDGNSEPNFQFPDTESSAIDDGTDMDS